MPSNAADDHAGIRMVARDTYIESTRMGSSAEAHLECGSKGSTFILGWGRVCPNFRIPFVSA